MMPAGDWPGEPGSTRLNLTSQWGDQKARFSAPVGILGNNVLSDPASCSLWMYADMALFVPEFPGGIKTAPFVRRSLDHWLDNRMLPNGNVIGYWDYDCSSTRCRAS